MARGGLGRAARSGVAPLLGAFRAGAKTFPHRPVKLASAMNHPLYRIISFQRVAPYSLRLEFDDGLTRIVDFEPVLKGELFGPLLDPAVFGEVKLDQEVYTVVWPSGADFDPATLHDWPEHEPAFRAAADRWAQLNAGA